MSRTCWVKAIDGFSYAYRSELLQELKPWREAKHKATLRHGDHSVSWYVYTKSNAAPCPIDALYDLSCACDDGESSVTDLLLDGCLSPYDKRAHQHMRYSYLVRRRLDVVLGADAADSFLDAIRA